MNCLFDANFKYNVKGNFVEIENAKISQLNSGTVNLVTAFTATPIFAGTTLTNLCGDLF